MGGNRRLKLPVVLCLCLAALPLFAGSATTHGSTSRQTLEIDSYCKEIQDALVGTTPFVFSGPDPWIEMDEIPASMPDEAVAYVYTTGAEIRWVFMRIVDEDDGWSEDLDYFYRDDGTLAKRIRHLSSRSANVTLDVTSYFADGKLLKESHKRQTLGPGRRDASHFFDPDAPIYWTTGDLPFPDILDLWEHIA